MSGAGVVPSCIEPRVLHSLYRRDDSTTMWIAEHWRLVRISPEVRWYERWVVVVDVPTAADFDSACISSLNMAWQIAYDLLYQQELAGIATWEDDRTEVDEYWQSAQPHLKNALGLIQQAHELGLKGKLAAVSPYLLISQDASRWPGGPGPVSFSSFRTVDAVDLPRAMELFLSPLSAGFRNLYEDLRKKRNTFAHGVSPGDRIAAIDLLKIILVTLQELSAGQSWPRLRLTYLRNDPTAKAYSSDHAYPRLLQEMVTVINALSPSEAEKFFGVDRRSRWYMCPGSCNSEIHTDEFAAHGEYPMLAQLRPAKTAMAEHLYCFVCGETVKIERTACKDPECPADVIFTDRFGERVCLTCDQIQLDTSGD